MQEAWCALEHMGGIVQCYGAARIVDIARQHQDICQCTAHAKRSTCTARVELGQALVQSLD
jgi:hypothetical protein